MQDREFFATLRSGQLGFPGYILILITGGTDQEAYDLAREAVHEYTNGKFCGLYKSISEVHVNDHTERCMINSIVEEN
jgi:hypothetical protein